MFFPFLLLRPSSLLVLRAVGFPASGGDNVVSGELVVPLPPFLSSSLGLSLFALPSLSSPPSPSLDWDVAVVYSSSDVLEGLPSIPVSFSSHAR